MRTIRPLLLALFFAVALAACGSSDGAYVANEAPTVAFETLNAGSGAVLIDIRTPEEVAEARIPGALNVDFYDTDFSDQLANLDRDATYVVYCRSGNRSTQSIDVFKDLGFTDVHMVDGGIIAWAEAGLPIEQ